MFDSTQMPIYSTMSRSVGGSDILSCQLFYVAEVQFLNLFVTGI